MLKVAPNNWFSWNFTIFDDDTLVAQVSLSWLREAGEMTIDGATHEIYQEGWIRRAFVLTADGTVLARAKKPSALFNSFVVESAGKHYELQKASMFGRKFVLLEGGRAVGSVSPEHAFTRKAVVDLPLDLPLAVRVFMTWLVIILWKRSSEGASDGGGGAVGAA